LSGKVKIQDLKIDQKRENFRSNDRGLEMG